MSEFLNEVLQSVDATAPRQVRRDPPPARRPVPAPRSARSACSAGRAQAEAALPRVGSDAKPRTRRRRSSTSRRPRRCSRRSSTPSAPSAWRSTRVTLANIRAAATEEKIHYEALTSQRRRREGGHEAHLGARRGLRQRREPAHDARRRRPGLHQRLPARRHGLRARRRLAGSKFARYAAEFMGVEAVHRALALQSLGRLGNDRAFMKFGQKEQVTGLPTTSSGGFYKITDAVTILESAGFGFGKAGSKAGHVLRLRRGGAAHADGGGDRRQHAHVCPS